MSEKLKIEDLTPEHVGRLVRITNPNPMNYPTVEAVLTDLTYRYNGRTNEVEKVARISRNQTVFPSDEIEFLDTDETKEVVA